MHRRLVLLMAALAAPVPAFAQAPATAPLALTLPTGARATALGGAWVAGRDQDVIFTNPAQLVGMRSEFGVTLLRLGADASGGLLTSVYAAGPLSLTFGWGVERVSFSTPTGSVPAFGLDALIAPADTAHWRYADAETTLITTAAAAQYKNTKIGAALKYAADRTDVNRRAWLVDVGAARNLFGGVAALSIQNLGRKTVADLASAVVPRRASLGWSMARIAGPLDLGLFTQVSAQSGFRSAAAGVEAGYGWIEGYNVVVRAGLRRPETPTERPVSLGAAITGDHLTVDYAVRFYDNARAAHVLTMRWR